MSNSVKGVERLVKAFGYSMKGLAAAWRNEEAFRQEAAVCALLLPLVFVIGRDALDYAVLLISLAILLITELLNSAIEALTDRVGTEHHELSGRAKDIASAAVFIAIVLVTVVWGLLAWLRFS